MEKLYKDEAWLRHEYIDLHNSLIKIGEKCGVTFGAVGYYMRKYNIPRRSYKEAQLGRKHTDETKEKIRNAELGNKNHMFGKHVSEEAKRKSALKLTGLKQSEETKKKKSIALSGERNPMWHKTHTPGARKKLSKAHRGKKLSPDACKHISEAKRREKNPNWNGGSSFEPYCPKFNDELKEEIRGKCGRSCFTCNKTEEENGRKLHVHHIDYNKLQGCKNQRWALLPLCLSCHGHSNKDRWVWFNLLINYWACDSEINFNPPILCHPSLVIKGRFLSAMGQTG